MRTSSAIWAAALAVMSVQGPILTTAEAAPAPPQTPALDSDTVTEAVPEATRAARPGLVVERSEAAPIETTDNTEINVSLEGVIDVPKSVDIKGLPEIEVSGLPARARRPDQRGAPAAKWFFIQIQSVSKDYEAGSEERKRADIDRSGIAR